MVTSKTDRNASPKEIIWILGGGKFGSRAATLLRAKAPAASIVMVEQQATPKIQADVELVCADGVEWLVDEFTRESHVSKIIPAIPIHLAADWLKMKLKDEGRSIRSVEIPNQLLDQFPHPIRLSPSKIVMSHADFICPDNCAEPDKLCSYTKLPRPLALYSILRTLECGEFTPIIVRSRQFAPGVGGFFPEDLWGLLDSVRSKPDSLLIVGTACKCHGVIDAFCHSRNSLHNCAQ